MSELDEEFQPLPYFSWAVRPTHIVLDVEECATALYLHGGNLAKAAERLKVAPLRLKRAINRSVRLQRLRDELYGVYVDKAASKVIDALDAEDSRVQWAAAIKILSTRAAAGHPLSPGNDGSPSLTINNDNREIIFKWRTEPLPIDKETAAIENSFDEKDRSADD